MSSENNPNANASATTSPTAPEKGKTPADLAAEREKASEADYITREQDTAKAAMGGVIGDMKQAAAQAADIKEWTRLHPWVMVGGAAVAGLAAGLMLMPGKKKAKDDPVAEFFGEHWEAIKDKLNGLTPAGAAAAAAAATAATSATAAQQQTTAAQQPQGSMLGGLIREVLKVVGPTLGGLVTGAIAGHQQAEEPHEGNGHQPQQPVGYQTDDPRDRA